MMIVTISVIACDDPLATAWYVTSPDTVELYSLSRLEHVGRPAALDIVFARRVVVESPGETGNWDFAVGEDENGFAFILPQAFPGESATSSIVIVEGISFDDLERAPSEGYDSVFVPLHNGHVYALRSREVTDASGITCRYYAKIEPVTLDAGTGTARLRFLSNPNCGDRAVVPPGQ